MYSFKCQNMDVYNITVYEFLIPIIFQVDQFDFTGTDVGEVHTVRIGHKTQGRGLGWYCEKVTVRSGKDATTETIFPCHRYGFCDITYSCSLLIMA